MLTVRTSSGRPRSHSRKRLACPASTTSALEWAPPTIVFGNGKTSLKVNLGRYLQPANNQDRYTLMNPAGATRFARTTNRTWNDRGGLGVNGDYVPQCDYMNPAANGECGPWQQPAFGQALSAAPINPEILEGWGIRPSDWQFGASVQHEILPRTSVEVGYHRRWFRASW